MKNYYYHKIDLKKLQINNCEISDFRKKLEEIEYRGYEVESLSNGNKIIITKPGGKSVYGRPKKEDFLVFIFNETNNGMWQISHKQILKDLILKSEENKSETITLITHLERTLNGEEPNDFINEILALTFISGETPETLIKAYKWIWGQEDVNYPNGEGRKLSWVKIEELKNTL
jgi:hypothetical protein